MSHPSATLPIDIYCRISRDPTNNEEGVRRQEKQIRTMLKARGLPVGKLIVDNDISASTFSRKGRPGFQEVRDRIENGASGGVAAYHSKRLIRRPREMEDFIDLIERTGALVLTAMSGDMDLSNAQGRLTARLFGALGTLETEELSERVKAQKAEARAAGKPMGGARPFGYDGEDRRKLDPVEGAAYAELFQRVIDGDSLSTIAVDWEGRGLLNRKGQRFDTTSLRAMISQKRAVGLTKDDTPGDWTPITTIEVQKRALAALKSRRTRKPMRGALTRRPAMLLSSFLLCGKCGKPLRAREGKLYKCDKNDRKGCGLKVNSGSLEREVQARLLSRLADPRTIQAINKLRTQKPDGTALVETATHLRNEIAGYTADAKVGEISRAEYKSITAGLKARLESAERQLDALSEVPTVSADPQIVLGGWGDYTVDEKRRHLSSYIDTITIEPANGVKVFDPTRVRVEWKI